MAYEPRDPTAKPSVLDRLFAGGSMAGFAVLMSGLGEAVYLYLR